MLSNNTGNTSATLQSTGSHGDGGSPHPVAMVAAIFGVLSVLGSVMVLVVVFNFCRRRKRQKRKFLREVRRISTRSNGPPEVTSEEEGPVQTAPLLPDKPPVGVLPASIKCRGDRLTVTVKKPYTQGAPLPILTADQWNSTKNQLDPLTVKRLVIDKVNLGNSAEGLFSFIQTCIELKEIVIRDTYDSSERNTTFISALGEALKFLPDLSLLDISHIFLGIRAADILKAVKSTGLLSLKLSRTSMAGNGKALMDCLKRSPQLAILNLGGSGLDVVEVDLLLSQLAKSCPNLQALNLNGHDLRDTGPKLGESIASLQKLVLVSFKNCDLTSHQQISIIKHINCSVEIIDMADNDQIEDIDEIYQDPPQLQNLRYLRLSKNHLSRDSAEKISSLLAPSGGMLLTSEPGEGGWTEYTEAVARIRDQIARSQQRTPDEKDTLWKRQSLVMSQ